jgi:hypothetical protein
MRICGSVLFLLSVCGIVVAAESTPAPVAPSATAVAAKKGPEITWSGLAMIRLREEIISNRIVKTAIGDSVLGSNKYSNRLAYKFGAKIQANPEVMFQFEIGNEWYATEEVAGSNYLGGKRNMFDPMFSLAYAQWSPSFMRIQAGLCPVKGSAALDLVGFSLLFGKMYYSSATQFAPAHLPWGVTANFMQPGMRVGFPILNGDVKLGIDVFSGVAEMRKVVAAISDKYLTNNTAVINIVDVPFGLGGLTLNPQAVLILNRTYRDDKFVSKGADHEYAGGLDAGYKINDGISLRAGFGIAKVANKNTCKVSAADTVDKVNAVAEYDRFGSNIVAGASLKAGPGKIDFDFNFGTNEDKKIAAKNFSTFQFVDLKYGWAVNKNFIIMPRARVYLGQVPNAFGENKDAANFKIWPELMVFGSF